ncbi:hypothetical protein GJAV_G00034190 [Gymnothorax javanicus]|nr:hypothetical protein GJAV_G00034190 [Gymnothorax javanicus]
MLHSSVASKSSDALVAEVSKLAFQAMGVIANQCSTALGTLIQARRQHPGHFKGPSTALNTDPPNHNPRPHQLDTEALLHARASLPPDRQAQPAIGAPSPCLQTNLDGSVDAPGTKGILKIRSGCTGAASEGRNKDPSYLDDWLVCAASPEQAREHTYRLLRHITAVGFRVNQRKCKLDPVQTSLTVLIFIARAFIAGGFQAAYVYTPEVYPTANRALGLGTSSGMARVGALITPFVAQVMLESSVYLTLSVYCCCCLLAAFASCALPIETTGRGLQESSHREWGQEMIGRAAHSPGGIPHSSSGSQD